MTIEQLQNITDKKDYSLNNFVVPLNETFDKYSINTNLRVCHFLAQVLHESSALTRLVENLNYSAESLLKTFKKYFNQETANKYAHQSEEIANRVYANRNGNRDESSGDGWKYKGRGTIQITFYDSYKALSSEFNVDFVTNPIMLESYSWAVLSAGWFWNKNNLNKWADLDDIITITKKVNGGLTNLSDRQNYLTKCKSFIL